MSIAHGEGRGQQGIEPLLNEGASLGEALRALREARNLTLEDIASATCIRRAYLGAIEEMKLDQLPSRPFAIGYVRAFADALGVDPGAAVAKFKDHCPSPEEALKAPVGVQKARDPRLSMLAAAGLVVVVAVVIWNVAQHAVARDGGPIPPTPVTANTPATKLVSGTVALAAAQPAPADSDVPKPYVTPGMVKPDPAAADVAPAAVAPVQAAFNPRGAIYGVPPEQSMVVLQASKAASLVVRGADGSIYFARQLAAGEAYRAPTAVKGLTIEVSDALAFNVFINGESKGQLPAAQTALAKLTG
jgi:cytoskeletal protein RodZ